MNAHKSNNWDPVVNIAIREMSVSRFDGESTLSQKPKNGTATKLTIAKLMFIINIFDKPVNFQPQFQRLLLEN